LVTGVIKASLHENREDAVTAIDRRAVLAGALAASAALTAPARAALAKAPVATTTAGKVRGLFDGSLSIFKGIPYGADTGPRRFQPPVPPTPWKDIRNALAFGHTAPQGRLTENVGEDCLVLNVWTPGLRDNGKRPVMVYIHGGAYANGAGSSALLDGAALARRGDVVVVTLNHRLNAFGYLFFGAHGPFPDAGNAGQLDLVLALQWVRDNIAEFGGDPACVMVFGQSGGGAKIATLMAMPAAQGLFHRAATMSGQQVTVQGPLNAFKRTTAFLAALGLTPERAAEAAALPMAQILEALKTPDPVIGGTGGMYFGPVLDDRALSRHPFYPDAAPLGLPIPMMIGNTHDETRGLIRDKDGALLNPGWQELPALLAANMRLDISPETVIAEYRRLYPDYGSQDVFYAATTAARSWRGAVIEDEARAAAGHPAWAYQVDLKSRRPGGPFGAPHTMDIALVFGTLEAEGSYAAGGGEEARAASAAMMDAFIAFARTGDPNHPGLPAWSPYALEKRETMLFDAAPRLAYDPRGAERRLFARVPFVQQGGEAQVRP
jgi:para-nitrobenzyl esterase